MRLPYLLLLCAVLAACDDTREMRDGGMPEDDDGSIGDPDARVADPDASVRPTSPLVDPECVDGMYSETLPDGSQNIADLTGAYSAAAVETFILSILQRRYPVGRTLVAGGDAGEDCIGIFLRDTSSASAVIRQTSTVVHECGHFYDNSLSSFGSNTYVFTDTLRLSAADGEASEREGNTFARSRIRNDEYAKLRPLCGGSPGVGCDFYADIYLDGDPSNGTFEGGDQGFNSLLEESVQYVNSLATGLAFNGELEGGFVSERDGILTFLWYLERYLRMGRLDFPSAHAHILTGDGGAWRRAVLTLWGRAWLYLEATEDMDHLGIDDDALLELVMDADLLGEIQRLRDAEGCPAP